MKWLLLSLFIGSCQLNPGIDRIEQQSRNIKELFELDQGDRVYPHRVNNVGKLEDIWEDDYRSFEIDVLYVDEQDCLLVGHDKEHMSDLCLIDFFTHIPDKGELKMVWLDVKNLKTNNLKKMLVRLEKIEKKWGYKDEFIFETSMQHEDLKKISGAGYHTSYYLPTEKIIDLLKEDDSSDLKEMAEQVSEQTSKQKVDAVSFDERLYAFVKDHLEDLLPSDMGYHTWVATDYEGFPHDTRNKLGSILFLDTLEEKDYYEDERVKTILVHYESEHHF